MLNADSSNVKGSNNINPSSKTSSKTTSNIPSINKNDEMQTKIQIDIDGLSEEEITDVIKNKLWEVRKLPYCYSNNYRCLKESIHIMTEWNTFYPKGFDDPFRQSIYELCNEALIQMCSSNKTMMFNKCEVSASMVLDKINQTAIFFESEDVLQKYISIFHIVEASIYDYETANKKKIIKNPISYMKSVIWNSFDTYKLPR